jgi:hypothetical protein
MIAMSGMDTRSSEMAFVWNFYSIQIETQHEMVESNEQVISYLVRVFCKIDKLLGVSGGQLLAVQLK